MKVLSLADVKAGLGMEQVQFSSCREFKLIPFILHGHIGTNGTEELVEYRIEPVDFCTEDCSD